MSDLVWPWTDWQQGARWDDWNWRRGLAAAVLVIASTVGSFLLAVHTILWCNFMGSECTAAELRRVDLLRVAAVAVLFFGPLMVFALRRRVVWALYPPALLLALLALLLSL